MDLSYMKIRTEHVQLIVVYSSGSDVKVKHILCASSFSLYSLCSSCFLSCLNSIWFTDFTQTPELCWLSTICSSSNISITFCRLLLVISHPVCTSPAWPQIRPEPCRLCGLPPGRSLMLLIKKCVRLHRIRCGSQRRISGETISIKRNRREMMERTNNNVDFSNFLCTER